MSREPENWWVSQNSTRPTESTSPAPRVLQSAASALLLEKIAQREIMLLRIGRPLRRLRRMIVGARLFLSRQVPEMGMRAVRSVGVVFA